MRTISRREAIKLFAAGAGAIAAPNILRAATKPLRIRRRWGFESFDPAFCPNFEDAAVAAAILAPPLRFKPRAKDADRWETEPHLAASWTVGGGGKGYAFDLRGETWKKTNSPIASDDVAFSFGRLAAKNKLPNAFVARDIAKIQARGSSGVDVWLRSAVEAFDTTFLATGYAAVLPKTMLGGREMADFQFAPPDHSGAYDIAQQRLERLL
jgi:ABC-type transport system substrate-binding protein